MKTFRAYVSFGYAGVPNETIDVEFDEDTTQDVIESEMNQACNDLLSNLDSGWFEVTDNIGTDD